VCEKKPLKPCSVCGGKGEYERWFIDGLPSSAPINDEEWEGYEKKMATCDRCDGSGQVDNMVREAKEVPCPKDQAIRGLLEENEDQGRIVIFAGFQGSVDRIVRLCHKQQWNVVKVDGRGWYILPCNGEKAPKTKPLSYWADLDNERVAFVAHPESGGMGLTLTESRMAVFYSNDFKPESRMQGEDRIHRPGMDENKGATIVDLFHLGTDTRVLNILKDNRRIERMTLGEFQEICDDL
jgi:SNF2 family DNA or RNA helicase